MTAILAAKLIEPMDVNYIFDRLKDVVRSAEMPAFIDISEEEPPFASITEHTGEVRYFYDKLKADDFIAEPYFYGYSYPNFFPKVFEQHHLLAVGILTAARDKTLSNYILR